MDGVAEYELSCLACEILDEGVISVDERAIWCQSGLELITHRVESSGVVSAEWDAGEVASLSARGGALLGMCGWMLYPRWLCVKG